MESYKRIKNSQFEEVFNKIADLMEIKGEIIYKILAYRRAAESIRDLEHEVMDYWENDRLSEIPGVGKAISEKINEFILNEKLEFLENLKAEVPESLVDLLKVPDLGPKKVSVLWKKAGISTLEELETAARSGSLRNLAGFGEKTEQRVIRGIELLASQSGRISIGKAWLFSSKLSDYLQRLDGVEKVEICGSLRRRKSVVGDIDLLVATEKPGPVMDAFVQHPEVLRILGHGDVKSSVEFANGVRVQLWCTEPRSYGTALQYAIGSRDHNVKLRELAKSLGFSLSEHAFTHEDGRQIHCSTENEVYALLGLPWIPPELRENTGEIQAAINGMLPVTLKLDDITSDFHVHSSWSDGKLSIGEMAEEAIRRGYKILAITDHSRSLGVAGGLSIDDLLAQRKEIDEVRTAVNGRLILLQGSEVEILADGRLDYPDEILATLDIVIASLHSSLRQPRNIITERLIQAIRNPYVDIIGHPTGRMILDREGADLDMDAVLEAAKDSGIALELNAHPSRLDLNEINCRRAAEMGIPIVINTDAHSANDFDLLHFGISISRRAWLQKKDVLNTWTEDEILKWLKNRKDRAL